MAEGRPAAKQELARRTARARSVERPSPGSLNQGWAGGGFTPATLLTLQRTVGNCAARHLLARPLQPRPATRIMRAITFTPGAAGGAGTFSAVGLAAEENGDGDGHTLARHVNINDVDLQARTNSPDIPAATRWASQAAAEAAAGAALTAREVDVRNWLAGGAANRVAAVAARARATAQLAAVGLDRVAAMDAAVRTAAGTANILLRDVGPRLSPLKTAVGLVRGAMNAGPFAIAREISDQADVVVAQGNNALARILALQAPLQQVAEVITLQAAVTEMRDAGVAWSAALNAARAAQTLEVRHDTAVAAVSAAFRGQAGVQLTTAPCVMLYLHYIDATHFQIKTAFPGNPVNLAPPAVVQPVAQAPVQAAGAGVAPP